MTPRRRARLIRSAALVNRRAARSRGVAAKVVCYRRCRFLQAGDKTPCDTGREHEGGDGNAHDEGNPKARSEDGRRDRGQAGDYAARRDGVTALADILQYLGELLVAEGTGLAPLLLRLEGGAGERLGQVGEKNAADRRVQQREG
jgi:hypothetical protein